MNRFIFICAGSIFVSIVLVAPHVSAAPATAWEDQIFSRTPITNSSWGSSAGGPNGMVTGGDDMFGDWPSGNHRPRDYNDGRYGYYGQPVYAARPYYTYPPGYYEPPQPTVIYIQQR